MPDNSINTEPVDKWLAVWEALDRVDLATNYQYQITALADAVQRLYLLLEPPSVRNIRQHQEDDE